MSKKFTTKAQRIAAQNLITSFKTYLLKNPKRPRSERLAILQKLSNDKCLSPSLHTFIKLGILAGPSNSAGIKYKGTPEFVTAKIKWLKLLNNKCITCSRALPIKSKARLTELPFTKFCSNSCIGKNTDIQQRKKLTCKASTGYESPLASPIIQKQIQETCMAKRGVLHHTHDPKVQAKIRRTNLDRRGTEYPMQAKEVIRKRESNYLAAHGIRHHFHDGETLERLLESRYKMKEIVIDGHAFSNIQGYEPQAIRYLIEHKHVKPKHITAGVRSVPSFEYVYGGKKRLYFPDILINQRAGIFIEVKSTYTYKKDKAKLRAKINAVRNAGHEIYIMIMSESGKLLSTPKLK